MRVLILPLLATLPAVGHDMWIEPAAYSLKPGEIVSLRLRVGQDLIGDPIPRSRGLINQFIVEDSTGRKPVPGREGGDPAGFVRATNPGTLVVGYRSNHSVVELAADAFDSYLKEEGLESVALLRTRQQTSKPVRELFSRCAKSLLVSGSPAASQGDRTLGFTLELTAARDPHALHPGEELPVLLTYENKPLPGALVVAMNRATPDEKIALRTGKDGRVKLHLPRKGMWLIKAVHMVPAPVGSNADWESFWASLTFEM